MKNLVRDLYLFATIFCIYFLGRIAILQIFPNAEAQPTLQWLWLCCRFDIMSSAYFLLPATILTILGFALKRDFATSKKIYANLAIIVSAWLAVVNVCFFKEYNNQFNFYIFGIFVDDFTAIVETIRQDYPVLLIILAQCLFIFAVIKFTNFIFRKTDNLKGNLSIAKATVISIPYIVLLVFAMRGCKFNGRPLQLRDTAITPSTYLNNLVPSSVFCLKTEIVKFLKSNSLDALKTFGFKSRDIVHISKALFNSDEKSIDKILTKTATGAVLKKKPSRIFLIIGESNSAWPLSVDLPNCNVLPEQKKLLKDAFFCKQALTVGEGTMITVSSLISGIPATKLSVKGVNKYSTNYAFAHYMKELGYASTFWYAGQSTWLQLGDFARFNKFDKVVGGESMGNLYGSVEWGLRDKDMFDFIAKTNIPENSFNMILTVSNHPPYDVDLKTEGCPEKIDSEFENKLWHHWYSDKYIADFIKKISAKYPDALFIITGDHPSRQIPETLMSSFKATQCIPIIFTGKQIPEIKREVSEMTHLDIMPTLIDMIAPKGYQYKSWGTSAFAKKRMLPAMNTVAISVDGKIIPVLSSDCPEEYKKMHQMYMALAFYRSISDGNLLNIKNNY